MTSSVTALRRRIRRATRSLLLAGLGLASAASAAGAADAAANTAQPAPTVDKSEWESGWHVVRPGDTLEGLAERFLGSHELWRELHLLNPGVQDPNLLYPGQRLRIFLERPTAKLSAQIMALARDVRELPTPVPWRPASEGDVLLERDALRTARSASARLRFDDGATVTLSEDSLVFIRRQTAATAPLPRKEIEIELGQIDIAGAAPGAPGTPDAPAAGTSAAGRARTSPDAIEVVVGGARSLATPAQGQAVSTRSRKSAGNLAQFMVFAGKSTVSAAGASLEVPAGSGTSVAPKAPPGPVEALLPAPAEARPAYGEEVEQAAPQFSWSPVPGADHYTVEVCRDPGCGALVARAPAPAAGTLQLDAPGGLPEGELFWRVTAVAPSGLDGFPSPAIRVLAVDSVRPPAPVLALRTAEGATVEAGGCVGALPDPVVRAADRSGAELPWALLLDGREIALAELRSRPLAGQHSLAARASDARGRSSDSAPIVFTVDAAAPWIDLLMVADGGIPDSTAPVGEARGSSHKRQKKAPEPLPACDSGVEFLAADGSWTPVPCNTGVATAPALVGLAPALTAVQLRTTGGAVAFGENVVAAGGTLSLATWDVGCGAREIALHIVPSPYRPGRMLLEAAVADGAGNRRTQGWHIARR